MVKWNIIKVSGDTVGSEILHQFMRLFTSGFPHYIGVLLDFFDQQLLQL